MDELALYGAITGTLGAGLGFMAFLRDAPRVRVEFSWDVERTGVTPDGLMIPEKPMALFRVANIGRRPIYVSHVHFEPLVAGGTTTIMTNAIEGQILTEGSKPFEVMGDQSTLAHLGTQWWRVRAAVVDSGSRVYRSQWPTKKPSFATEDAPPLVLIVSQLLNWFARSLPF